MPSAIKTHAAENARDIHARAQTAELLLGPAWLLCVWFAENDIGVVDKQWALIVLLPSRGTQTHPCLLVGFVYECTTVVISFLSFASFYSFVEFLSVCCFPSASARTEHGAAVPRTKDTI